MRDIQTSSRLLSQSRVKISLRIHSDLHLGVEIGAVRVLASETRATNTAAC